MADKYDYIRSTPLESLGFERHYEAWILAGLPGFGEIHQIARPGQQTFSEGVVIKVKPHGGDMWIGNCQKEWYRTVERVIYDFPNPSKILIKAGVQGYLVNAFDPADVIALPEFPLRGVWRVPERDIVITASWVILSAYDKDGEMWSICPHVMDDLTIEHITSTEIHGYGFDMGRDNMKFVVDVESGEVIYADRNKISPPSKPKKLKRLLKLLHQFIPE